MKIRNLTPSLGTIEHDLFGTTEVPDCEDVRTPGDLRLATPEAETVSTPDPALPAFLADAIARRHAATLALPERPWAAGQIRRLNAVLDRDGTARRPLARPVALLLDRQDGDPQCWSGWLVAPETDYASAWDLLLEHDVDDPFDPLAGMVQVWNPLLCRLADDAPLLAAFTEERLAAVRAVAAAFPHLDEEMSPRPGFVAPRPVAGHHVLTGTPLGDSRDPRRAYQSLYFQLGREMCLPATRNDGAEPAADNVVPLRRKTSAIHRKPFWMALAASVLVVQSGIIGYLYQGDAARPVDESSIYRSGGDTQASRAQIEVGFRADATEQDIRRLLVDLGAEIVGGPGQLGFYQLRLPDGDLANAIERLKAHPIVEFVEEIRR